MGAITLKNFRTTADVTMNTRLKDGGVSIDWAGLTNIKAWLFSDAQKAIAGRCDVSINQADSTLLVCEYSASKPQYLGVNRLILQAKYQGRTKTYDVPVFNFVSRTAAATGTVTIDDPTVDVEIEVQDVTSSILDNILAACIKATEEAQAMIDMHQGIPGKSPYIGEDGHWYEWDEDAHQYVDTETNAKGDTGETPDISIGTVTTVEPGQPAGASMGGTPEAPVLNLSIPQGAVGATPNFTIGTVTTGQPGTPVIITITGTAEAPVLNIQIPQGMKGDTGVSADYPITIHNGLDSDATDEALAAFQGKVLDGKVTQLGHDLEDKFTKKGNPISVNSTAANWYLKANGLCAQDSNYQMRKYLVTAWTKIYLKLTADSAGVYQFQSAASVPSSGTNANLVGSTVTVATDAFVTVPPGATHLIVSELKTNTTNEVKDTVQYSMDGEDAKIVELDRDVFGWTKVYPIIAAGRLNSLYDGLTLKSGVKYILRAKCANTPTAYVDVSIRDAGENTIVSFGQIRDNTWHEKEYTPASDLSGLYTSLYVSEGTAAGSVTVYIFDATTVNQQVADLNARFGFSGQKVVGSSGGRMDFTGPFSLEAGKEYVLSGKLSFPPVTYITIALRDSGNNELVSLGQLKDAGEHTAIYVPSTDITGAYIYVYSSGHDNTGIVVSAQLSLSDTVDGAFTELSQKMDIVAANEDAKNKLSQVKRQPRIGGTTQGITPLVLIHFSDIHGSTENLQRIVRFNNAYKPQIDDVLNTGDTMTNEFSDTFIVPNVPGASAELLAIGNHDSRANGDTVGAGAVACYEKYIKPYVSSWGVTQPEDAEENGYNYYYKDYAAANVRLIVLDSMFWDASELAWLESVLADAKTNGIAVVCAAHYAGGKVTPFEIPWNTLQYTDVSDTLPATAPAAVQDFIDGGGEFVCWLSGHGHFDMVGPLDDYPQQMNIAVDTASYGAASQYSDIQRTRFTRTEDLFNIFSVDTFNKTIRVFRVGADRDAQLRHRGDLLLDYTTATVLYVD